jgi:hypothetical protein
VENSYGSSGSLSSTRSFEKVAADKAQSIVFLANKDDTYEADAESVLSVLALQPLLDNHSSGNVVVEVSKKSTADLLNSLSGLKVSAVQNLSSKLFVQCSRQCGLINVYQQLLDHGSMTLIRTACTHVTYLLFRGLYPDLEVSLVPMQQLLSLTATGRKNCFVFLVFL